jgi:hypothetical protein
MSQIFHPHADKVVRLGLLAGGLLAIATMAMLLVAARSPVATYVNRPVPQPVEFSHRLHSGVLGIECLYCHTEAPKAAFAGMPSTAVCMNCHSQIQAQSPLLDLVRHSFENDVPVHWNRVNQLPDFAFFDHSAHLQGGIGCETCHGRVDLMSEIWKAESLQMAWCLDCHREPERFIRPREHIYTMGYQPAAPQAQLGRELAAAYGVQPRTDCSVCHR